MISIHKALAGLDFVAPELLDDKYGFQSTRPSRASTIHRPEFDCTLEISIHKALAGLDFTWLSSLRVQLISIHKALAGLDRTSWT